MIFLKDYLMDVLVQGIYTNMKMLIKNMKLFISYRLEIHTRIQNYEERKPNT